MNKWGTPDWRNLEAYEGARDWSFYRWRWEFFRRRKDVREFFEDRAEKQYQEARRYWEKTKSDPTSARYNTPPPIAIEEPGFTVLLTEEEENRFGYRQIPNPRIGDQPFHVLFPALSETWESMSWGRPNKINSLSIYPHQVAFAFSLDKPWAIQFEHAKEVFLDMQEERHGRKLQRRRHPTKWLAYLRTLDAREAGETWAEIKSLHPQTKGDEQAARDAWEQARALCFNF